MCLEEGRQNVQPLWPRHPAGDTELRHLPARSWPGWVTSLGGLVKLRENPAEDKIEGQRRAELVQQSAAPCEAEAAPEKERCCLFFCQWVTTEQHQSSAGKLIFILDIILISIKNDYLSVFSCLYAQALALISDIRSTVFPLWPVEVKVWSSVMTLLNKPSVHLWVLNENMIMSSCNLTDSCWDVECLQRSWNTFACSCKLLTACWLF